MKKSDEEYRHLSDKVQGYTAGLPEGAWQRMADILDGKQPVPSPKPARQWTARGAFLGLIACLVLALSAGFALQAYAGSEQVIDALPIPLMATAPVAQTSGTAQEEKAKKEAISQPAASAQAPPQEQLLAQKAQQPAPLGPPQLPEAVGHAQNKAYQAPSEATEAQAAKSSIYSRAAQTQPAGQWAAVDPVPTSGLPESLANRSASVAAVLPVASAALPRPWAFGLKAGVDARSLQVDGLAGAFLTRELPGKWALQAELQYKRYGSVRPQSTSFSRAVDLSSRLMDFSRNQERSSAYNIHLLELPLTARFQLQPRWHLFAGGQLAVAFSADGDAPNSIEYSSNWKSSYAVENAADDPMSGTDFGNPDSAASVNGVISRFSFGLAAGSSYQLTSRLGVDLRYLHSLGPLAEFSNGERHFNRSLQLALTWRLGRFGGKTR